MPDTYKAYQEGYSAYKRGENLKSNPYKKGTLSHVDWLDGYGDAKESDLHFGSC